MNNTECLHKKTAVVDSRLHKEGIARRRECVTCGARFSTIEVPAELVAGRRGGLVPTQDSQRALELESKFRRIQAILSSPEPEDAPN